MARVLVFLIGLALFFASFTEAEYMKYKDPKQPLGMRIKDLIKRMTLKQKIGQMTQIERKVASAGRNVKIVQEMTELVPGLQGDIPSNATKGVPYVAPGKTKVAACAKHFVGDVGTTDGINENNTVISTKGLLKIHMPGYYNSIIKRVSTVMMYANREWITVFLKDTLNFRGIVISDWEASDRITSPPGANYTYSIQASISAGLDMIMVQMDYQRFIDGLTFVKKFIPMSRIDNVVNRILRVKFVVGLFENPFADNGLVVMIGREEHTGLIWEAARKSLALLKHREAARKSLALLKDREAVWKSLALLKDREREAVWKSLLLLKDREAVWKSLLLLKNGEEADEPLLPLSKKAPRVLVEGSHAHIFIFFISRRRFFYLVHLSILLILPVFLLLIFCLARSFSDLFVP